MVFRAIWSIESQSNYQSLGYLNYLNVKNATPLLGIYIETKKFRRTLVMKLNTSKPSF